MSARNTRIILGLAAALLLAVPTAAFAHATISGLQPAPYKTAARTAYLIRVPNEKASQNTIRLDVFVPGPVQEKIKVKKVPGWKIKLHTRDTGGVDAEGAPIKAITRITYYAHRQGEIEPHFYEEFPVRFQNPAEATRLCFPMVQMYRGKKRGTVERAFWTGPSGSAKPASCLDIVA